MFFLLWYWIGYWYWIVTSLVTPSFFPRCTTTLDFRVPPPAKSHFNPWFWHPCTEHRKHFSWRRSGDVTFEWKGHAGHAFFMTRKKKHSLLLYNVLLVDLLIKASLLGEGQVVRSVQYWWENNYGSIQGLMVWKKTHILKASVNGCRTEDVCQKCASSLIVWGLPLYAALLLSLSLCLCSCLSSSAFWKLKCRENGPQTALQKKNGGMTMGLLKPLGHPNAHPIDVIDFPFC